LKVTKWNTKERMSTRFKTDLGEANCQEINQTQLAQLRVQRCVKKSLKLTLYTAKNSMFCRSLMCFIRISEETTFLHSIKYLVFKTETKNVYCAVRAVYLNKFHLSSVLKWLMCLFYIQFSRSEQVTNLKNKIVLRSEVTFLRIFERLVF
jgi:hypothetical protein